MDHVVREKQGVLFSDAPQDERFNTGQSIVRFGIREVICVPMKGRHETLGVLYLDTVSSARDVVDSDGGKFTEDHLALAIAVAHQAALAVEETRYHHAMVQAERLAAIGQTIAAAVAPHQEHLARRCGAAARSSRWGWQARTRRSCSRAGRLAEKNQGKIYDLVMDMLSYSKEREPASRRPTSTHWHGDVVELWCAASQGTGDQAGVAISKRRLQPVAVDPEGIHRALLNIVGNALDAVEGKPNPHVTVGHGSIPKKAGCESSCWTTASASRPRRSTTSSSRSSAPRGRGAPAWAWR